VYDVTGFCQQGPVDPEIEAYHVTDRLKYIVPEYGCTCGTIL